MSPEIGHGEDRPGREAPGQTIGGAVWQGRQRGGSQPTILADAVRGGPGCRLDSGGGGLCPGLPGRTGRSAPEASQTQGLGLSLNWLRRSELGSQTQNSAFGGPFRLPAAQNRVNAELPTATPCAGIRPSDSPHNRLRHGEPPGPPADNNRRMDSHKLFQGMDLRTLCHKRRSRASWPCSRRPCPAAGNRRTEPGTLPADRGSACPHIPRLWQFPPPDRRRR